MNLAESVSHFSIKFEMQSVMVCVKKIFNGEITFHLRGRLTKMCYDWLDTNYCQVQKNLCTLLSWTKYPFTRHEILLTKYIV